MADIGEKEHRILDVPAPADIPAEPSPEPEREPVPEREPEEVPA